MEFEWDEGKDAANTAKHGVSLGDAVRFDWTVGETFRDERRLYGEERWLRYALLDGRLFSCVFTLRGNKVRIISLRKSNRREIRDHGQGSKTTTD